MAHEAGATTPAATEQSPLLPDRDDRGDALSRTNTRRSSEPAAFHKASDEIQKAITPLRACIISGSLGLMIFLQACNFSLLSTTQSTIAADLDAYGEVIWFTSAYLIGMSSVSPLMGRLSQVFSPRLCIFVSTIIFAAGSLLASQAKTLPVFLSGRAVAGVGAAGVLTITIILAIELTGKKRRALFIGLANTAVTCGVSLGAVLGGAILEPLGWPALFWLQAVLALPAGLLVFLSIPKGSSASEHGAGKQKLGEKLLGIDYAGAILLIACVVTLLTGLSSPQIQWVLVAASVVLLAVFVANEAYLARDPVIPVAVLKSRGTLFTCFAQLAFMASRWTVLFYTPVFALAVRQWSPPSAGSILVPTNAGFALGGLLVGWIHIRSSRSFYVSTLACYAAFPVTLVILAQLSTPASSMPLYFFMTFLNGFATGAALNYTIAHLLYLTPAPTHYVATSLLTTFRGFSGSFGSAIGGGIFTRILHASLDAGFGSPSNPKKQDLIRRLLGSPALVASLKDGPDKDVAIGAYQDAVRGLFYAGCALALLAIACQASTGWKGPASKRGGHDGRKRADDDDGGGEEEEQP